MWGPLLALALLVTINPIRIAIILLVLSRARPMANLLAYWIGAGLVGSFYLVVALIVFHSTSASAPLANQFTQHSPSPTVQRITVGLGMLLVLLALLMALHSVTRERRARALTARTGGAHASAPMPDPSTIPIPLISRLMRPVDVWPPEGKFRIRQLLGRAQVAWQQGSPWISFVFGLLVMPIDGVLFALALIITSGATLGVQIGAAIAFIIGHLAVEEVILVSNIVAPAKTQGGLRRLHDWSHAHHRKFMAAILALVGASLIFRGM